MLQSIIRTTNISIIKALLILALLGGFIGNAAAQLIGPDTPPRLPNLIGRSDSGFSPTDNITDDDTPTIRIRDVALNATIIVTMTGNNGVTRMENVMATIASATDAGGNVTFTTPLPEGIYTVTATQTSGMTTSPPSPPLTVEIYTSAPEIMSIRRQTPGTELTRADSVTWRVTFNRDMNGGTITSADFSTGTTTTVSTVMEAGSNDVYDVTVTDLVNLGNNTTISLGLAGNVAIMDLAGNSLPTALPSVVNESYTIDRTAPTITSIRRQTPGDELTNADSVTWRVTFSEAVASGTVNNSDFSVAGTTATVSTVTGSDAVYDVTVTGGDLADLNDTISLELASSVAIMDLAGNSLFTTLPTGTNNESYIIDNTAPTIVIAASGGGATDRVYNATVNDPAGVGMSSTRYAVVDTAADCTPSVSPTMAGTSRSFAPADNGNNGRFICFIAQDTLGNTSTQSQLIRNIGLPAPPSTPDLAVGSDTGTSDTDDITNDTTPTFSVGGVEDGATVQVTATRLGESDVTNTETATGTTASVTLPTLTEGTWSITATQEVTGSTALVTGTSPASSALSVTITTGMPTIASIRRQTPGTELTRADTVIWQVTFDMAVTGVDISDFSVTGTTATASTVTGSDAVYDVTVTGGDLADLNDTISLELASSVAIMDLAGNSLFTTLPTGTNNESYIIDNTAPTIVIAASGGGATDRVYNATVNDPAGVGMSSTRYAVVDTAADCTPSVSPTMAGTSRSFAPADNGNNGRFICFIAQDTLGNTSTQSQLIRNIGLPAPPSTPDLAVGSDTGTSDTDDITNDTTPTFSVGGVEDGATVQVTATRLGESDVTNTETATGTTASVTLPTLTEGTWSITATQEVTGSTALVTGTSPASSALSVTITTGMPTIASIRRQTPGTELTRADTVIWQVTFDMAVTGVDISDFSVTGTTATASTVTGSDDVYDVTVTGGDLADLNDTISLELASSVAIMDLAGNSLFTTLPTGTNNESYIIDNTAPTIVIAASGGGATDRVYNATVNDPAGVGMSSTRYAVVDTAADCTPSVSPTMAGTSRSFAPADNGNNGRFICFIAQDTLGNTSTQSQLIRNIGLPAPPSTPDLAVGSDTGTSDTDDITNDTTPTFSVGGVEDGATVQVTATRLGESDVTNTETATGTTASVTLPTLTEGTWSITATQEVTGSTALVTGTSPASSALSVTITTGMPTIASIRRQTPGTELTRADTVIWQVTFDMAVTGVDISDFSVTGTTATASTVTGSDDVYDVTVTGGDLADLNDTISLELASSVAIMDLAGNSLFTTLPTGTNNESYIIDNTAPTIVIAASGGGATDRVYNATVNDPAGVGMSSTRYAVVDTAADCTPSVSPTMAGTSRSFAPADNGNNGRFICFIAQDTLGNTSTQSQLIRNIGLPAPPSTPDLAVGSDTGTSDTDDITNDTTPTFSVGGVEDGATVQVTATRLGESDVTNTETATGTTASVTLPTLTEGTWSITATQEVTGSTALVTGTSPASSALSVTITTGMPTIASIRRQTPGTELTRADTVIWQVTFDMAVTGVDISDFSVTGTTATASTVTGSDDVYDVTVTGGDLADLNDTISLELASSVAIMDLAGNSLFTTLPTGTNNESYIIDNTAPTIVIAAAVVVQPTESTTQQ